MLKQAFNKKTLESYITAPQTIEDETVRAKVVALVAKVHEDNETWIRPDDPLDTAHMDENIQYYQELVEEVDAICQELFSPYNNSAMKTRWNAAHAFLTGAAAHKIRNSFETDLNRHLQEDPVQSEISSLQL